MQWTVRYFSHKSERWAELLDTPTESDNQQGAGAVAYAKRKQSIWKQLSIKSDQIFSFINNAYKSPL